MILLKALYITNKHQNTLYKNKPKKMETSIQNIKNENNINLYKISNKSYPKKNVERMCLPYFSRKRIP